MTQQNKSTSNTTSSDQSTNHIEQSYVSSIGTTPTKAGGHDQSASQSNSATSTARQENAAQKMAYETGLDYTADVIRQEKLKPKNQKAMNSLTDRMLWQREESISKSVNVSDKGELENYDDTPGLGSDKPGV